MPAGSRLWMELAATSSDADGDSECLTSWRLGLNPSNGSRVRPLARATERG